MNEPLTPDRIRALCGRAAYDKGVEYERHKRIVRLERDPDGRLFDAVVRGTKSYRVHVELHDGAVSAYCECPAHGDFGSNHCKHVAAVLCRIASLQRTGAIHTEQAAVTSEHLFMARTMISIFDRAKSADDEEEPVLRAQPAERLAVEYACAAHTNARRPYFSIEMKLGTKRLYVIQKIKTLLAHVDAGTPYELAKLFTFDPKLMTFDDVDRDIVAQLADIARNESDFRELYLSFSYPSAANNERSLVIPPYAWDRLLPLLLRANVRFEHAGSAYDGFVLEEGKPPISFLFDQPSADVYRLQVTGLDELSIMDKYGYLLAGNRLYRIDAERAKQMRDLKGMFDPDNGHQLLITPSHLELLLARVVPGLKGIGSVLFSADVQQRIVTEPLRAKLMLDRSGDRLTARLEYVYGDVTIDPFEAREGGRAVRTDRILLRDGDKENRVMALMEQIPFQYNGKELHLDDSDDIYDFLFHTLPQLERWTEVFVTPEVERMIDAPPRPPKLSIELDARTDWLEVRFDLDGIGDDDIRNILLHMVEKKKYYRVPGGGYLSLEDEAFARIGRLLDDMNLERGDWRDGRIRLSPVRGLPLIDSPADSFSYLRLGQSFRSLLEHVRNPDSLEFPLPDTLNASLRDYQKLGYQWMKTLANYRFGGILADDMGLGKTLQSIAFLLSELDGYREAGLPSLIVCPASLTYNWKGELRKFAPTVRAAVMEGDKSARGGLLEQLENVDVLITSYPLLRRDIDLYSDLQFGLLILDEAQAIKNHATQTARSVKDLQAKHRFALTGTPVENRLEELWSIFDAVFPELFRNRTRFQSLSPEQVARRVRPFVKRRLKSDVLKELPDKIETVRTSELLDDQKKLYVAYLAKLQEDTVRRIREEGFQRSRIHILAGMTRLRQLCCHPSLFLEGYEGASGKLEQLMEIVEECREGGNRMLIFSQFTGMLELIRAALDREGVSYFYLDGSTPARERVELCRRYNEGEGEAFLISLMAGGTGLNLTGADTVVLFDLWWNPAVEQQAADRAHRIGQKKVVQVIRLVTEGTIEEKMFELQQRKRDLIDAVIGQGDESGAAWSEDDIRELLSI